VEGAVWQYTRNNNSNGSTRYESFHYFIPSSIRTVTITNQSVVNTAAFNGCTNIKNIVYLNQPTEIGDGAFQNCSALEKFQSSIDGTVCLTGEFTVLGNSAFRNCLLLENFEFDDSYSFVKIGKYAFENTAIKQIVIPKSVETIDYGAFKGCTKLSSITLPFVGKSKEATAWNKHTSLYL